MCSFPSIVFAQSIDVSSPSPVGTNEIAGRIAARDLGDSRLTDHFYAFAGTPGDLLITVMGNNLNGDVDVFTASGLRPLLKFALYAESITPVTKSIFLRKREDLILRVEARTPNDDEGIYQIRLGGSFEPILGEAPLATVETPTPESLAAVTPSRGTRRVSSVGARIAEPPPPEEVETAAPTPKPTPAPVETSAPTATPEPVAETEAPRPEPPRTVRRGAARRRPGPIRRVEPPPEPEAQTGPRLIIEMLDGTRVEHFMSTLKRVTVENNQIVMVNKLGRIQRILMLEVKRVSIEP